MNQFLTSLVTSWTNINLLKFKQQTQNLEKNQQNFLLQLISQYQNTELGQKLNLHSLQTVAEFRAQIPPHTYNHYEPYIHRMMQGENNLLTPESPIYFNFTSGTTGKQKIIPVTKKARYYKEITKLTSLGFLLETAKKNKRNFFINKSLLTSSVQFFGYTDNNIPYGPVSVGDLHFSNFWQKQIFVHPYDALKIKDIIARNYVCLLFALKDPNLTLIGANYPVIALSLAQYLEQYASELIENLKKGIIPSWLEIEPKLRQKLAQKFQPHPHRAKQLVEIYQTEGQLTPKLAWPSLEFIITARGLPSNFYLQKFPKYFGDTPVFGGVYAAAEAVFGIYPEFNEDGSILAINSNFFEFIPQSEWQEENPQTQLPHEVEIGEQYRILVTNYTGLYRYDIGDIIKVVGFYHQTPLITFLHRAKGILSSTTEKTTEYHLVQIIQTLQRKFKLSLENFCITLSEDDFPPAYILNLELNTKSYLTEPEKLLRQFDAQLQELNTCYKVEREGAIPPPILRVLETGSFAKLSQKLIKKGMPESQVKILHLSQNREYLSDLKVIKEFRISD